MCKKFQSLPGFLGVTVKVNRGSDRALKSACFFPKLARKVPSPTHCLWFGAKFGHQRGARNGAFQIKVNKLCPHAFKANLQAKVFPSAKAREQVNCSRARAYKSVRSASEFSKVVLLLALPCVDFFRIFFGKNRGKFRENTVLHILKNHEAARENTKLFKKKGLILKKKLRRKKVKEFVSASSILSDPEHKKWLIVRIVKLHVYNLSKFLDENTISQDEEKHNFMDNFIKHYIIYHGKIVEYLDSSFMIQLIIFLFDYQNKGS